jgi:hypothetical protein
LQRGASIVTEESLISDEMRAAIGKEGEPVTFEVDKTTIRWFARAVGHTDLIFYDEKFAQSKGHRSMLAPPGFLGHPVYSPQGPAGGPNIRGLPRFSGIKVSRALNGGTELEYHGVDVCAGDVLTRVTRIADIQERTGSLGKMLIITSESNYRNAEGKLVATERNTSILY